MFADPSLVEVAMRAVICIMSDDLEGAEEGLSKGNSSFHKVYPPHSSPPRIDADGDEKDLC